MTKTEEMKALLEGKNCGKPSMYLWKHFPPYDEDPKELIKKTIQFQECFQWPFVKVTYQGLWTVQDWGSEIKWPERDNVWPDTCSKVGVVTKTGVQHDEDWTKLEVLPVDKGAIADAIAVAKGVVDHFKGEVPVVITMFNPLTTAAKLAGDKMLVHMRRSPDEFRKGLDVICETTANVAAEMAKAGVDGIFFATQLGTYDKMSVAEYEEYGRPYDMRVLEKVKDLWFNITHMHGSAPMFDLLEKYPAAAINWHDQLTDVSLADAYKKTDKLIIGGVEELHVLRNADDETLKAHFRAAIEQVPNGRLILGPGCCVPSDIPEARLQKAKDILASL